MEMPVESTVLMRAISVTVLGETPMSKAQLYREKMYQATMSVVRRMQKEALLSEAECRLIDEMFLAKYQPLIGTLSAKNR